MREIFKMMIEICINFNLNLKIFKTTITRAYKLNSKLKVFKIIKYIYY